MPLFNVSIEHHRTYEDAKGRLTLAVDQAQEKFGPLIQRVEWSESRDSVELSGAGFLTVIRVDSRSVHATGDAPLLGRLLGSDVAQGIKGILRQVFPKSLT
ncbi:hypothetical protein BH23PLA1_BH23PLA1_27950 [soil metagenome]